MTTSPTKSFLHEILAKEPIPAGRLAYFRARLQDRIYDLVVEEYMKGENAGALNKAELARRIRKDPAQITRMLSTPGNWTLDTISDLLLGISAAELDIGIKPLSGSLNVETNVSALAANQPLIERRTNLTLLAAAAPPTVVERQPS